MRRPQSRWVRATNGDGEALRELAGSYWYCAYAWWRRSGWDAEAAATATLACFTILDGPRGGLVSHSGKPSRDAILRASIRTSPELKSATIRVRQHFKDKSRAYLLGPGSNLKQVVLLLHRRQDAGAARSLAADAHLRAE